MGKQAIGSKTHDCKEQREQAVHLHVCGPAYRVKPFLSPIIPLVLIAMGYISNGSSCSKYCFMLLRFCISKKLPVNVTVP